LGRSGVMTMPGRKAGTGGVAATGVVAGACVWACAAPAVSTDTSRNARMRRMMLPSADRGFKRPGGQAGRIVKRTDRRFAPAIPYPCGVVRIQQHDTAAFDARVRPAAGGLIGPAQF